MDGVCYGKQTPHPCFWPVQRQGGSDRAWSLGASSRSRGKSRSETDFSEDAESHHRGSHDVDSSTGSGLAGARGRRRRSPGRSGSRERVPRRGRSQPAASGSSPDSLSSNLRGGREGSRGSRGWGDSLRRRAGSRGSRGDLQSLLRSRARSVGRSSRRWDFTGRCVHWCCCPTVAPFITVTKTKSPSYSCPHWECVNGVSSIAFHTPPSHAWESAFLTGPYGHRTSEWVWFVTLLYFAVFLPAGRGLVWAHWGKPGSLGLRCQLSPPFW